MLLDLEYDHDNEKYKNEQLVELYSNIFLKIMPHIYDITLEGSFYSEDEDKSPFQDTLLSLICYLFKTIEIRKLILVGLKPRHLQFIIIHFTNSNLIPRIIYTLAANLNAKTRLDNDISSLQTQNDSAMQLTVDNIFSIAVRACLLLFRFHMNNSHTTTLIRKSHKYLANFVEKCVQLPHEPESEATWQKLTNKVIIHYKKQLVVELNSYASTYQPLNSQLLFNYFKIIEYHYNSVSEKLKDNLDRKLINFIRKAVSKCTSGRTRTNSQEQNQLIDACFSLAIKIYLSKKKCSFS